MSTTTGVDLSALLSKPADDVKPPKPLNDGIYLCQAESYAGRVVRSKDGTDVTVLTVTCKVLQELEVEQSNEVGELPKTRRVDFWLTPDSLYRFKEFMESTLKIEGSGKLLMEMATEMPNRLFKAMIVQSAYIPKGKTESAMIDNIKDTYPVD
jgi:hypothetical protein